MSAAAVSDLAADNQVDTTERTNQDQKEWIPGIGETVLNGMELMTVEGYDKEHPGYLVLKNDIVRRFCMTRDCVRPTQANLEWTTTVVEQENVLHLFCPMLNWSGVHSYFEQRWREGLNATELIKDLIFKRLIEFVKAVTIAYCVQVDGVKLFR